MTIITNYAIKLGIPQPTGENEILRFAQNDDLFAQNDDLFAQNDDLLTIKGYKPVITRAKRRIPRMAEALIKLAPIHRLNLLCLFERQPFVPFRN